METKVTPDSDTALPVKLICSTWGPNYGLQPELLVSKAEMSGPF